jgi:hypothetical protein
MRARLAFAFAFAVAGAVPSSMGVLAACSSAGKSPSRGAPDAGGEASAPVDSSASRPDSPSGNDAAASAKDSSSGSADAGGGETSAPALDGGDLFAGCSLDGGCLADCAAPASDPLATGNAAYDLYDGCLLAGMQLAGISQAWQGQLLKSQSYNESGITPLVTTNDDTCGGQNCGPIAISAGSISGDSPPGPCGSSAVDPATGMVDYSHSYGLFQETPACEGTFLLPALPSGYSCTGTTEANNIPFDASITFYCESATSIGAMTPTGTAKGYIDAVQDPSSPLYATSIFNPAYQLYVYLTHAWPETLMEANAQVSGCTEQEQWYLGLAYWLTGDATTTCTPTGDGLQYVQTILMDYETVLYNKTWPYPGP